MDRADVVARIQKYCTRLREATTVKEYYIAYCKCIGISRTEHFLSRGKTDEDTWDSVVPFHDLVGLSGDALEDLIKANRIPYNSQLARFSPRNRITHKMAEMRIRIQSLCHDGSIVEKVTSVNFLPPLSTPVCLNSHPLLENSVEVALNHVSESIPSVTAQSLISNVLRPEADLENNARISESVAHNPGMVDHTVPPPVAASVQGSGAPSVIDCSLEDAVHNALTKPWHLDEPERIECRNSPLSHQSQTPRSVEWGREGSAAPASQSDSVVSPRASQNSEPEIGRAERGGGWNYVYRHRDNAQWGRQTPAQSVSSWSIRGMQERPMDDREYEFNHQEDVHSDADIAAALRTPMQMDSPVGNDAVFRYDLPYPRGNIDESNDEQRRLDASSPSSPRGELGGSPLHGNCPDDLPMFQGNAFEPSAMSEVAASVPQPPSAFSLSEIPYVAQQQPMYPAASLASDVPAPSVLPSLPALNVEHVHRQAGQQMSSMQLRSSIGISRARGGRNMHLVGGRESSDVPAGSYLPPQMPFPATVLTNSVPSANQGMHLDQSSMSEEVASISMSPTRRRPGRPLGFKPVRRAGVKLGRPFGSTKNRGINDLIRSVDSNNRNTRRRVEQYPANGQSCATPLTPSLVNAIDDEGALAVSQYELDRLQNMERNRRVMISLGLELNEPASRLSQSRRQGQQRQPRQPRQSRIRDVVTLDSVFVSGRYEGDCPGWVYDRKHLGYLKEAFSSKTNVLGNAVLSRELYRVNGLFRRFEVVRVLGEDVISEAYSSNQISGRSVFGTLEPDTRRKIFRRGGNLLKEEIMQYLKIDWDKRNDGLLDIGNFKYCRGMGESLMGEGLYVKYFKESDFSVLRAVYPELCFHYTFQQGSDVLPAGYYYHDRDDQGFSQRYDCVHVAHRNVNRQVQTGSDEDSDGVG